MKQNYACKYSGNNYHNKIFRHLREANFTVDNSWKISKMQFFAYSLASPLGQFNLKNDNSPAAEKNIELLKIKPLVKS